MFAPVQNDNYTHLENGLGIHNCLRFFLASIELVIHFVIINVRYIRRMLVVIPYSLEVELKNKPLVMSGCRSLVNLQG